MHYAKGQTALLMEQFNAGTTKKARGISERNAKDGNLNTKKSSLCNDRTYNIHVKKCIPPIKVRAP